MINNNDVGKTGRFPRGKISKDDEGELSVRMAADLERNILVIDFGTPCKWLGLPKKEALEFGNLILKNAEKLI